MTTSVDAWVGVVVPARNAATSVEIALQSLRAQTMAEWRAIVVENGSSDDTAAVADRVAAIDPRVRVTKAATKTAAAARNVGAAAIGSARLLFLDADDRLEPDHLAALRSALEARPDAQAAYCGDQRILPTGALAAPRFDPEVAQDPMTAFARRCAVAIHAVVVERAAFEAVGGFDPTLRTCEDWDLWQRLARMGVRFAPVPRPLAVYAIRPGSLSSRWTSMIEDARRVISTGFRRDLRLTGLPLAHPDGAPSRHEGEAAICIELFALWCLAAAAGRGEDLDAIVANVEPGDALLGVPEAAAQAILEGCEVGVGVPRARFAPEWEYVRGALSKVLTAIETRTGVEGAARAIGVPLERELLRSAPVDAVRSLDRLAAMVIPLGRPRRFAPAGPFDVGLLRFTDGAMPERTVGLAETPLLGPLARVEVAALAVDAVGAERYLQSAGPLRHPRLLAYAMAETARAMVGAAARGRLHGPRVARALLRDGILRRLGRLQRAAAPAGSNRAELAGVLAKATAAGRAAGGAIRRATRAERGASTPSRGVSGAPEAATPDDRAGYWDAFFTREDPWSYHSDYEQEKYARTLAVLPDGPIGSALEIGCAEGVFTEMLAPRVKRLIAADVSARALERAQRRCASDRVEFRRFDLEAEAPPTGMDLIVCSELLYYLPSRDSLEEVMAALVGALREGGRIVHAHAFVLADDSAVTGFDWGHPFGAATVHDVLAARPELALERSIVSELYRVDCFRKGSVANCDVRRLPMQARLTPEVERFVVWDGAVARRADVATHTTDAAPVLVYHGFGTTADPSRRRWTVSPDAFRDQMRLLRREGYHAIGSAEFSAARRAGEKLHGKPVMITVDDGRLDFAEIAWPLLRAADLFAEVFAVVDRVGGAADWDDGAPLMDWPRMEELVRAGARFGSHLCRHRRATTMGTRELADELARSRATLSVRLQTSVVSLAAPHGAVDERFVRLAAAAGYEAAYGMAPGVARLDDHPLKLRRLEVSGDLALADFAAMIGQTDEHSGR